MPRVEPNMGLELMTLRYRPELSSRVSSLMPSQVSQPGAPRISLKVQKQSTTLTTENNGQKCE